MLILLNLDFEYNILKKNSLCDKMGTTHKAPLLHTLSDDWQILKAHV